MITVDKQDAITLKINHAMAKTKKLDMDVYLFIPGELGLTPEVLSESAFFYSSITQKRAYYSDKTLLPLVHSRLAKRGRLSIDAVSCQFEFVRLSICYRVRQSRQQLE